MAKSEKAMLFVEKARSATAPETVAPADGPTRRAFYDAALDARRAPSGGARVFDETSFRPVRRETRPTSDAGRFAAGATLRGTLCQGPSDGAAFSPAVAEHAFSTKNIAFSLFDMNRVSQAYPVGVSWY